MAGWRSERQVSWEAWRANGPVGPGGPVGPVGPVGPGGPVGRVGLILHPGPLSHPHSSFLGGVIDLGAQILCTTNIA